MEFLTLLIVLGLLQWWGSGGPLQRDDWFRRWRAWVGDNVSNAQINLLIIVAGPCLLVLLLQSLFESSLFGMLSLFLYVAVLLFSLGRGDFTASVQAYLRSWNHGDFEAAYERATAIGDFRQSDTIDDSATLHDRVRMAAVYEGFERWFAVVFWFLLLGPAACAAYRLCYLTARQHGVNVELQQLALQVTHYLDWLPARLLAFSFTLTGNFVNGFNRFWQFALDNLPIPELLDSCAEAAISGFHELNARPTDEQRFIEYGSAQLHAVQSLLSRSVVCWLIVIAALQFL